MFDSHTKVIVLASSTKKKTSPRFGSTGYVVGAGDPKYMPQVNVANGVIVAVVDVLFTRYGLGKDRYKAERREVINVFPVIRKPPDYEKELTIWERVDRAITKFRRESFSGSTWYDVKSRVASNPDSINVCIMAPTPVYKVDLTTCPIGDFVAWFDSYIYSYCIKTMLAKICGGLYAKMFPLSQKHVDMLFSMNQCTMSKSARSDFINHISTGAEGRKIAVETLRAVESMSAAKTGILERDQILYDFKNGRFAINSGRDIRDKRFFEMLTNNVFSEHKFDWKKQLIISSKKLKDRKLILSRIEETKDALQNLAKITNDNT